MANAAMIARLAELREFAELKSHFDERRDHEVTELGRKLFANPEAHDRFEAERLKGFYAGVDAVLSLPLKARRQTQNAAKA